MDLVTEQRLARRSMILASVRQMIVDRGYEAVTIRDLAEVCRVSVPTLYNQFGGKDQLLAAAIEDHFKGAYDSQDFQRAKPGLDRLVTLIDQSAQQLLESSTYHQRLISAFSSLASTHEVQMRVATAFAQVIVAQLNIMQAKRQLAEWVIPSQLAGQMVAACIGTAVQWSGGTIVSPSLRSSMCYAMGLVLLGTVRGQSLERISTMVQEAQATLPAVLALATNLNGLNSHERGAR
jgi:AcrR family transcriptional regulator